MQVFLWFYGEPRPRALVDSGRTAFLRTTTHTDKGTQFKPSVAELHRSALQSYARDKAAVWVA